MFTQAALPAEIRPRGLPSLRRLWARLAATSLSLVAFGPTALEAQESDFLFRSPRVTLAFHGGFHIWRHFKLRDNALRIMAPKVFYRWL